MTVFDAAEVEEKQLMEYWQVMHAGDAMRANRGIWKMLAAGG